MVVVKYTFRSVFSGAACCFDLAGSVLFKILYSVWLGRALAAYGVSVSKRSLGLLGLKARDSVAALEVAVYIFFSSDILRLPSGPWASCRVNRAFRHSVDSFTNGE